jgi:hypothetical protein
MVKGNVPSGTSYITYSYRASDLYGARGEAGYVARPKRLKFPKTFRTSHDNGRADFEAQSEE